MKTSNHLLGLLLCMAALTQASAADVGVSVNISQPGFYGRIDIGRVPGPTVIYPQPIIIEQHPVTVVRQPIYLRVPPGHEKNWGTHCRRYNACGQPVYFVQDNWYREVYAPRYYAAPERRDGRGDDRVDNRGEGRQNNGNHGRNKVKKGHGGD
jgi:hypothetical protein